MTKLTFTELLYSRSLTKDYRWMVAPRNVPKDGLNMLLDFFNLFDRYKGYPVFQSAEIPPHYFLKIQNLYVVLRCTIAPLKDEYGRNIYAMEGICIQNENISEIKSFLSDLLRNNLSQLDIWSKRNQDTNLDELGFKSAEFPEKRTFRLINFNDTSLDNKENNNQQENNYQKRYVTFDKNGFDDIKHVFHLPATPLIEFLFGATPEMEKMFPSAKIIAPVYKRI
jgi:hypothetical protein